MGSNPATPTKKPPEKDFLRRGSKKREISYGEKYCSGCSAVRLARQLRELEVAGSNQMCIRDSHYIPRGGMFRYVSSANYFGELTEWVGFAIASWSWAGAVFAWWTFANLAPRAASLYKRYEKEFGQEFTSLHRKRIIPFILSLIHISSVSALRRHVCWAVWPRGCAGASVARLRANRSTNRIW